MSSWQRPLLTGPYSGASQTTTKSEYVSLPKNLYQQQGSSERPILIGSDSPQPQLTSSTSPYDPFENTSAQPGSSFSQTTSKASHGSPNKNPTVISKYYNFIQTQKNLLEETSSKHSSSTGKSRFSDKTTPLPPTQRESWNLLGESSSKRSSSTGEVRFSDKSSPLPSTQRESWNLSGEGSSKHSSSTSEFRFSDKTTPLPSTQRESWNLSGEGSSKHSSSTSEFRFSDKTTPLPPTQRESWNLLGESSSKRSSSTGEVRFSDKSSPLPSTQRESWNLSGEGSSKHSSSTSEFRFSDKTTPLPSTQRESWNLSGEGSSKHSSSTSEFRFSDKTTPLPSTQRESWNLLGEGPSQLSSSTGEFQFKFFDKFSAMPQTQSESWMGSSAGNQTWKGHSNVTMDYQDAHGPSEVTLPENALAGQSDVIPGKREEDEGVHCHVCNIQLNNAKQYEMHCSGALHRKNIARQGGSIQESGNGFNYGDQQVTGQAGTSQQGYSHQQGSFIGQEPTWRPQMDPGGNMNKKPLLPTPWSRDDSASSKWQNKDAAFDGPSSNFCELCQMQCKNIHSFNEHCQSFTHCKSYLTRTTKLGHESFKEKFGALPFLLLDARQSTEPQPQDDKSLFIARSGLLNKYECRHVTVEMSKLGTNKFVEKFGDLPGVNEKALLEGQDGEDNQNKEPRSNQSQKRISPDEISSVPAKESRLSNQTEAKTTSQQGMDASASGTDARDISWLSLPPSLFLTELPKEGICLGSVEEIVHASIKSEGCLEESHGSSQDWFTVPDAIPAWLTMNPSEFRAKVRNGVISAKELHWTRLHSSFQKADSPKKISPMPDVGLKLSATQQEAIKDGTLSIGVEKGAGPIEIKKVEGKIMKKSSPKLPEEFGSDQDYRPADSDLRPKAPGIEIRLKDHDEREKSSASQISEAPLDVTPRRDQNYWRNDNENLREDHGFEERQNKEQTELFVSRGDDHSSSGDVDLRHQPEGQTESQSSDRNRAVSMLNSALRKFVKTLSEQEYELGLRFRDFRNEEELFSSLSGKEKQMYSDIVKMTGIQNALRVASAVQFLSEIDRVAIDMLSALPLENVLGELNEYSEENNPEMKVVIHRMMRIVFLKRSDDSSSPQPSEFEERHHWQSFTHPFGEEGSNESVPDSGDVREDVFYGDGNDVVDNTGEQGFGSPGHSIQSRPGDPFELGSNDSPYQQEGKVEERFYSDEFHDQGHDLDAEEYHRHGQGYRRRDTISPSKYNPESERDFDERWNQDTFEPERDVNRWDYNDQRIHEEEGMHSDFVPERYEESYDGMDSSWQGPGPIRGQDRWEQSPDRPYFERHLEGPIHRRSPDPHSHTRSERFPVPPIGMGQRPPFGPFHQFLPRGPRPPMGFRPRSFWNA